MKRIVGFLLALGLVLMFSLTASAVDVKFSGEYFAAGLYLDKVSLVKKSTAMPLESRGQSTAFYEISLQNTLRLAAGMNACLTEGVIRGSGASPLSS